MIEYGILGPLAIRSDGVDAVVTAPKPRTLLVALLLDANRVVSVDRLIDVLWPDDAPASAAKLVQVYVWQLRAAVHGLGIETVAPGYRLAVLPDALDAARFERLHAESRRVLVAGNADLALTLADRALALWRGPALAEVSYAPFAVGEAGRLEALRLDCVEHRLDALLVQGKHELAVPELERLCADHPLRERAREQLALALYRTGRQADALAVLATGRRLLRDELGLDPAPGHQRLEQSILTQSPTLDAPSAPPTEWLPLPRPPTRLVGRRKELQQLTALVQRDDVRLVTVTGPGGTGKTRLALELAASVREQFANGVLFVELAPLRDPDLVLPTIARQLGLPESTDSPSVALARRLQGLEILLVVDNAEHVIGAASGLAGLVRDTDRMTVLVTSRRVLRVAGEHVFAVQPLPVEDATQLFADCVEARGNALETGTGTEEGIVESICRRLDCLPLAVELAAARTTAMSLNVLLDRLNDRVSILGVGPRDAPARQRTLMDTIAWSAGLLGDEERRVFADLTVFAGGSTVAAAEVVCATSTETIEALVDSSLVQRQVANDDARLTMLETVREQASTYLDGDDRAAAETAHLAYYAAFTGRLTLRDRAAYQALPLIDPEIDNLRLAIDRATAMGDDDTAMRIAVDLNRYWETRGLYREGIERIAGPLERGAGDPGLRATALCALARLSYFSRLLDCTTKYAEQGIASGTSGKNLQAVRGCHNTLGLVALDRDELATAAEHLERAEAIAVELGLVEDILIANGNLADLAMMQGDNDEARRRWEWTLTMDDDVGLAPWTESMAWLGLGAIARRQANVEDAEEHYARAYRIADASGFLHNKAVALIGLAGVAVDRGAHTRAAQILAQAEEILVTSGIELTAFDAQLRAQVTAPTLAALGVVRLSDAVQAAGDGPTTHVGAEDGQRATGL